MYVLRACQVIYLVCCSVWLLASLAVMSKAMQAKVVVLLGCCRANHITQNLQQEVWAAEKGWEVADEYLAKSETEEAQCSRCCALTGCDFVR